MPCRTTAAAGRRDSAALAADSQAQSVHPSRLPVHDPGLQALLWAQPECMLHPGQVYSCPAARRVLPDWLQVHVSQLPSVHVESPCKIAWCDASHCCLELTHAGCISLLKSAGVSRPPLIVCSSSRNVDRIACASIRGVRTCRQYQDGFYCQAPQTPSYNFSDPNFTPQGASATPAAATTGRHLLQASNSSAATNSTGAPVNTTGNATVTCNKIKYYGNCGELKLPAVCLGMGIAGVSSHPRPGFLAHMVEVCK